jgi:hypothetical protein
VQEESIINSDWLSATSATNEQDCLDLNGLWMDPEQPCCINLCEFECVYDPNSDNWKDCGFDGYCPDHAQDSQGNEQSTECNGKRNFGEGMEGNRLYDNEEFKGEFFIDRGNGIIDPEEYFYDANNNDEYDFPSVSPILKTVLSVIRMSEFFAFEMRSCSEDPASIWTV